MPRSSAASTYALGSTDAEHERLIHQAAIFDPFTERLFRDAGVGLGHRVLDIGCGLGDVSMLVARLIGPTGAVVGLDNDASALAKAKERVTRAGLRNVSFVNSDIAQAPDTGRFDAIVGRLILQFLPDPSAAVASLTKLLRRGGVLVIQDACWDLLLHLLAHLPLRSKCASLIRQAFQCTRTGTDMELVLYRIFQQAGLPTPQMRIEIPAGTDPDFARWVFELFCSLRPRMQQYHLTHHEVGDLNSLQQRLEAEASAARAFGATIGLVGAWSRKP